MDLLTQTHRRHQREHAAEVARSRRRHDFYYDLQFRSLAAHIKPHGRVLALGLDVLPLLERLAPSVGVGLEYCPEFLDHPTPAGVELRDLESGLDQLTGPFDHIVVTGWLPGMLADVQGFLQALRRLCHHGTRLYLVYFSRLWQPVFRAAEALGQKAKNPELSWIPLAEMQNLLDLAGYQTVTSGHFCLLPARVPVLSAFFNGVVANLPLLHHLCVDQYVVARPLGLEPPVDLDQLKVSVLVPARNEAGNLEAAITRTPRLAPRQEFIFVEGGSSDDTWRVIQELPARFPDQEIVHLQQPGKGKGDAVRAGFARASGDILIILDADLTVPPEDLPKFVDALVQNKGDFINGSRLVYPMAAQAMRFFNLLGNRGFGILLSYLLDQRLRDSLCGTKVVWRQGWEDIQQAREVLKLDDPFGDFDMLFGAALYHLKITDLPIRYQDRTYGDTNISRWSHGVQLLKFCWQAARKLKFRM